MYTVREGKKEDLPAILELIKELALYEKAPEEVTNTLEMMEKDGFGPQPVFGFYVLEKEDTQRIIGTAIYYYRYSTWKGKRLYLEDYIVTEKERGKGAGKLLFERVMAKSLEEGCTGMMWQVLDWNEPAIRFYKKYSARMESEWINCNLQAEKIKEMLAK
ncbi:GNAT family N-acetyltransferase [Cyclobacterium marinum]|uniref:GCN5-related N-acetyltransferase n=1 Tax=Cyclobacterium marinum (strain ATCC 25205 / DSM 745 / LMG 13164 / NCIMB 1802) TaxID=880070 RepID=G0J5U9_CYCMS|nr:GNAT family N-acetyltransferase [Cyclobacterium marinum]AEL25400.1 GCN5-related N-acetyltransferase [Cyclobacterium marinum DSM 745]MBI0400840.1 GNAT family N-acetyltransferase [Cyclobacterium marinum]MBR9777183.1 GNAT family N-acetyltransferase [Cytophagales bacterium]|tara:strand:+ start:1802 stop:2281 length:480 start_codon:yes stop_codon:yes gene_type:complete